VPHNQKLNLWAATALAALSYCRGITGKRTCQLAGCLLLFWAQELAAEQVRVMQWNVHGNLGTLANNSSAQAKAIARIVNYNHPDVLLLNETDYNAPPATATALIDWVTNNLPYMGSQPGVTFFVSVSAQPTYDSFNANAAISKYPILNDTTYNDGLRGLHAFKLQLATTNLQVFHTHIKCCSDNCPKKQTEAQFDSDTIKAFAATNSLPYIFGGDWNEDEQNPECTLSATYHPITTIMANGGLAEFKPTTRSGEYRTWSTASTPSIRFDYLLPASARLSSTGFVFSTMDWAAHGLYTNAQNLVNDTKTASDHFCVFADYSFSTPAPGIAVSPTSAFASSGTQSGPFSPSSQIYTLTNGSTGSLSWTATVRSNWLTLSATSGTLAAGATTDITVSVNANANSLAANTYSDTVGFTNTSNGVGNTTRTVTLTVNPTPAQLAVGPTSAFSSSGYAGGPFSPSGQTYGLTNVGGTTMNWTVAKTANWLTLSATSGSLAGGASTTVTVSVTANANSLAAGTYSDSIGFTNVSNGAGNTSRSVSLTVNPPPAQLAVTPASGFSPAGYVGGPFNPASQTYGLTNTGGTTLNWTAAATANWLTLSATSGTLAAGAGTNVTVSVNANANSLAASTYPDTIEFTNASNGAGNTSRAVSLTVNPSPGQLAVGPSSDFTSSGYVGGPFSPASQTYGLTNVGGTALSWTATTAANWLTLSATSGALAPGASINVTVSVNENADSLPVSAYSDTLGFTNTSNGAGNTSRAVSLTVNPPPAQLAVGPLAGFSSSGYVGGPFSPASQTYGLTNVGGTALNWTASVTADWLSLSAAGGTLAAGASTNVTLSVNANAGSLAISTYFDTVSFTNVNNGLGNAADTVTLTVNPLPAQLVVGPLSDFSASGIVGGPFSPACQIYGLTNAGGTSLDWTATITAGWLSLSAGGGTLAPGASTNVTVSFSPEAESLPVSFYSDTVSFTNTSNGIGNAAANVNLMVLAPAAQLAVGPLSDFSASGYRGGPFSPGSQTYSLTNLGATALDWTATVTADWLTLSAAGGTLDAGASTNVTLSISSSADSLDVSAYADTISFTNTSNGVGDTNWPVNLTINHIPPIALFTGSPTGGAEPLTVTFTDTSTGDITNRFWDFGDGVIANTTETRVTHTYAVGTYDVMLVASGPGGASTNSQANYITALTPFQSWQVFYFGSVTNPAAAPGADADHDGMSNTNEFLAGTDPTNSASVLGITTVARQGNDLRVTWTMGSGRTNVLQQADLIGGTNRFTNVFTLLTVGSVTNYLDVGAATNGSARYYRVRLGP
jgi:PKD repeat protein